MCWRISSCLVLFACIVAGCGKEDDNTISPDAVTPPVDTSSLPPTTQQLLTGPRSTLDVKLAPITLQVPPGWKVHTYNEASLVTIEGPTPTDSVGISISLYRTISADQEKSLESHARQDFAEHPDLMSKPGIRDIDGGKVIEQLIVDAPLSTTQPATPEPIQTMQWTYTLCIADTDGKEFNAYDLKFLGMTLKQYKADQVFLRSIMDSLAYSPSADILTK